MLTASLQVKLGDFGVARGHENRHTPEAAIPKGSKSSKGRRWSIDMSRDLTSKCGTGTGGGVSDERVHFAIDALPFNHTAIPLHHATSLYATSFTAPQCHFIHTTNPTSLHIPPRCPPTARYMAPEVFAETDQQRAIANYSSQADIWSLGMVLFYVFENHTPIIHPIAVKRASWRDPPPQHIHTHHTSPPPFPITTTARPPLPLPPPPLSDPSVAALTPGMPYVAPPISESPIHTRADTPTTTSFIHTLTYTLTCSCNKQRDKRK